MSPTQTYDTISSVAAVAPLLGTTICHTQSYQLKQTPDKSGTLGLLYEMQCTFCDLRSLTCHPISILWQVAPVPWSAILWHPPRYAKVAKTYRNRIISWHRHMTQGIPFWTRSEHSYEAFCFCWGSRAKAHRLSRPCAMGLAMSLGHWLHLPGAWPC